MNNTLRLTFLHHTLINVAPADLLERRWQAEGVHREFTEIIKIAQREQTTNA